MSAGVLGRGAFALGVVCVAAGCHDDVTDRFQKAKLDQARIGASALRNAALIYQVQRKGCPSAHDLLDERLVTPRQLDDPWARPYQVVCQGRDVQVISLGPDGKADTDDDVRASEESSRGPELVAPAPTATAAPSRAP